ncbi:MAG: diguanylate cyclase [Pseudomonadota bacterium]
MTDERRDPPEELPEDVRALQQRYSRALQQLEAQERQHAEAEKRLRHALVRLTHAGDTRYPELARHLTRLREAVRDGAAPVALEPILQKIAGAVSALEDLRRENATVPVPLRGLERLLRALELPPALRRRARTAMRQLEEAGPQGDVDQRLQEFTALLDEIVAALGEGRGGWLPRLFRGRSGPDNQAVREALTRLVAELTLPTDLARRAADLQEDVGEGPVDAATILEELADLAATARARLTEEQEEMAGFLQEVSDHLQELDSHIREAAGREEEAAAAEQALDAAVSDRVRQMQTSVHEAEDLPTLKTTVSDQLGAINAHLEEYRSRADARRTEMEREMERVHARMESLEVVTGVLRERLASEREQALRDPLTGVYNRLAWDERLNQELARFQRQGHEVALAVWDLDGFKAINDTYGHTAGDKVIRAVADLLVRRLRATDFVARYGGEEFVVLMPDTPLADAADLAEELRGSVAALQFVYRGERVPITISCGLTALVAGDTAETAFQRADATLYRAKDGGRDRVIVADPPG